VTVTVSDSTGDPQADLPVYVFSGDTYKGFSATTNATGTVKFTLPEGNYRFRTDLHGAQYFSATENDCTVTTCTTAAITVPVYGQVTVTTQSSAGLGQADLPVYAFNGDTYTGISGVTGKDGKTILWLPAGDYRFRADQFNLQFFSGDENSCTVPGCTTAVVNTLGIQQKSVDQTIDYTYDPLGRLTNANYDDGRYYTYTYDAVGNRLTETTEEGTDTYIYDANNRISSLNGTYYGYDGNGNLRWDSKQFYSYDGANHLTQLADIFNAKMYTYSYDGLGDLLNSTTLAWSTGESSNTNYIQDIAGGLSQVLSDGTNTYLYGYNRISQTNADKVGYFLDDAIGSVRQAAGRKSSFSVFFA
jgi:YD repeat-containing protein